MCSNNVKRFPITDLPRCFWLNFFSLILNARQEFKVLMNEILSIFIGVLSSVDSRRVFKTSVQFNFSLKVPNEGFQSWLQVLKYFFQKMFCLTWTPGRRTFNCLPLWLNSMLLESFGWKKTSPCTIAHRSRMKPSRSKIIWFQDSNKNVL